MANVMQFLPALEGQEMAYVQSLMQDMSDQQAMQFAQIYGARRKDPQTIMILALIGFAGVHGIHRFVLNHIGMGILYLLTGGICLIGTIVDLVNYQKLTFEFNQPIAQQAAMMVKGPGTGM
jgi:TM2 domain-containing membrane protein YozV